MLFRSTHFFDPAAGGDPVLWQHLFWLFGHPEVYILILPAMGIVSEILPVFARKPLFGYQFVVFSGIAIGFIGFGVWAHHMFAVGLGPVANTAFGVSTMIIAIPTGVKIFNWLGTLWKGDIRLTSPMLFSLGFVGMFVIGGLSGVTHAVVPADYQQTDTYYIVAHFHYVLFGGAIFGLFSGIYFWWPKVFGRMLSERVGKAHFWTMLVGFNLTFAPFHVLGLQGMPRRIQSYPASLGLGFWNLVSTVGSFVIALSILVFIWNAIASMRKPRGEVADPWDARTLEWGSGNRFFVHHLESKRTDTLTLNVSSPRATPSGTVALTNARIVTLDHRKVIERGTLVVKGSRISCVGTCTTAGADKVIDAKGKTIIPGWVDMHSHHYREWRGMRPAHDFEQAIYLAYGVTTTMDVSTWSQNVFPTAEIGRAHV